MPSTSERQKRRDLLQGLNTAIQFLGPAGTSCGFPPAQAALGSACALLGMIKVRCLLVFDTSPWFTIIQDTMANKYDFLDLAQLCVEVCKALEKASNGKERDQLRGTVPDAIERLQR
jgi:hypothetical protein